MAKIPYNKRADKAPTHSTVLPFADLDDPAALTPLNFRVSAQFHREFKLYAVRHGISMVDLLQVRRSN